MARGRTVKTNATTTDGVWNLVVRDHKLNEEGLIPNFVYENILGICVTDVHNIEVVKLKNIKVTDDNITSVSKVYKDKYGVGDEFQEWISLYGTTGCYCGSISYALLKIKEICINNNISKLKEEETFNEILKIIKETNESINHSLKTDILPKLATEADNSFAVVRAADDKLKELEMMYEAATKEYEELMKDIKEKKKFLNNISIPASKK